MSAEIYYLDEQDDSCRRTAFLLRLAGHRCNAFNNREEFLNCINNQFEAAGRVDLLVINHLIVGQPGAPLIDFIKALDGRVPVVMVEQGIAQQGFLGDVTELVQVGAVTLCSATQIRAKIDTVMRKNEDKV